MSAVYTCVCSALSMCTIALLLLVRDDPGDANMALWFLSLTWVLLWAILFCRKGSDG